MSNFSLFSFNSGKSSLAHINYWSKENRDIRSYWWKPENHGTFDIRTHGLRTFGGYQMSNVGSNFVHGNHIDSDCKKEKVILKQLSEQKGWWEEKHETKAPNTCWKENELVLTLRPDQSDDIRLRFEMFYYTVKISPLEKKPGSYVVKFPNRMMAEKALAEANIIGYKLRKKRRPRPSPKCPIIFKALRNLKIRNGKAFSKSELGWVNKDDLVIVNQVKGRRARLMFVEDDKIYIKGWVSLHTSNGIQLLEQTDVSLKDLKLLEGGLE